MGIEASMAGLARIAVHWRFSFVSSSSSRRMTLQAPGTPSAWNCRPVLTSRMLARQCLWAFSGPSQADSIQNLKTKTRSISGPCVITLHLPHSNAWQACEKDYIIQLGKTKGTLQVRPRRTKQRAFPSLAKIFTCTNVKRIRRAKIASVLSCSNNLRSGFRGDIDGQREIRGGSYSRF